MPFALRPASFATHPWVKLCGVRDAATAIALAELRPDAIGLNFFPLSPRCVSTEVAAEIAAVLPAEVAAVGVFVNADTDEILQVVDAVGLRIIQLHGDEPPASIAELKARRPELLVVRAWRLGDDGMSPLAEHLQACDRCGATPDALLVDAKVTGAYGGTGHTAPWALLRDYEASWPPLILAGGLTPANVAAAIETVRPWGVDTAGGVERSSGAKDPALAAAFLEAVRSRSEARP